MTSWLVELPGGTARIIGALLEIEDLRALCAVSKAARIQNGLFVPTNRRVSLHLSPTDHARARQLLDGIHRYDPQRLALFTWIEVATPQHADLLLEPGTCDYIESVSVTTPQFQDEEDAKSTCTWAICDKLRGLRLTKLDVSFTALVDVSCIANMTQLRELNLSHTRIQDISCLAVLTQMQVLRCDRSIITNLNCITTMRDLRELHAENAYVPPLRALTKLKILTLGNCTVESAEDLAYVVTKLEELELRHVRPRHDVEENLSCLSMSRIVWSGAASRGSLTETPRLRVLRHVVTNVKELAPLLTLQEIHALELRAGCSFGDPGPLQDFRVLLTLPELHTVTVRQFETENETQRREASDLVDVLVQLPNLTSLDFSGFINAATALPKLHRLKHLTLDECVPEIQSLDWISSFQSLRSLTLTVSTGAGKLDAIGKLVQLEDLVVTDMEGALDCLGFSRYSHFGFIAPLVNLTRLVLDGDKVFDLSFLENKPRLHELRITAECLGDIDVMSQLVRLRSLTLYARGIHSVASLLSLHELRSVAIPEAVDCSPLLVESAGDHKLLRILHPTQNCVAFCPHREERLRCAARPKRQIRGLGGRFGWQKVATRTTVEPTNFADLPREQNILQLRRTCTTAEPYSLQEDKDEDDSRMLQPLKIDLPQELSPRQRALTKLKSLAGIRVNSKTKHDGQSFYVIDLYLRATTSLSSTSSSSPMLSPASMPRSQLALHDLTTPVTSATQTPVVSRDHVGDREPDLKIEKTYLQLFALRDELSRLAFACRSGKRCRLCQEMFSFTASMDQTPPAVVRALSTSAMKKKEMEKIVNAFVGIVVRAQILTTSNGYICKSDDQIPVVIQEFLGL